MNNAGQNIKKSKSFKRQTIIHFFGHDPPRCPPTCPFDRRTKAARMTFYVRRSFASVWFCCSRIQNETVTRPMRVRLHKSSFNEIEFLFVGRKIVLRFDPRSFREFPNCDSKNLQNTNMPKCGNLLFINGSNTPTIKQKIHKISARRSNDSEKFFHFSPKRHLSSHETVSFNGLRDNPVLHAKGSAFDFECLSRAKWPFMCELKSAKRAPSDFINSINLTF